jgi:Ca2+-binding EF-hand superfamily protein
MLLNPKHTEEMQKKFTMNKQEYISVFRVLDKDNIGYITTD